MVVSNGYWLLAGLAPTNDCFSTFDDLVYVSTGLIALAISGTKLVEYDSGFKWTNHHDCNVCADRTVGNLWLQATHVALGQVATAGVERQFGWQRHGFVRCNHQPDGNSALGITIPVLGAGVLYLVASFVDKRDDSADEK